MSSVEFENFLKTFGRTIDIELSFRLFMHDCQHLLFVESGDLDLYMLKPVGGISEQDDDFYILMAEENRLFLGEFVTGPLHYLCNVTSGDVLYPFRLLPEQTPYKIVLKANKKSVLKKIPFEIIEQEFNRSDSFRTDYCNSTEFWIASLMDQFAKHPINKQISYLETGINVITRLNSQIILPRHRHEKSHNLITWGKLINGFVLIAGLDNAAAFPISPLIPLHPSFWFENVTPLEIEVYTAQVDIPFKDYLQAVLSFHNYVIASASYFIQHDVEIDEIHLKLKKASDEIKLRGTYDYLGSVLESESIFKPTLYQNHLIRVCEILFHEIGKNVIPPLKIQSKTLFSQIYEISVSSKVQSRKAVLKPNWWKKAVSPLLIQLHNKNHPESAAIPDSNGDYFIRNPEEFTKKQTVDQKLAEQIDPECVVFYRSFPEKVSLTFKKILAFCTKGNLKNFVLILLAGFLANIVTLFVPFLNKVLFDTVIPNSDENLLYQLLIGLLVVAVSGGFFTMTREYAILRLEILMTHNLEIAYWIRLLTLPLSFFRKYSVGDLYLRLISIGQIRSAIAGNFSRVAINSLFCAIYLVPMLYFSPSLTFLAIIALSLVSALMFLMFMYGLKIQRLIRELGAVITGKVLQIISGISKIRIYGVESRIFSYWGDSFTQMKLLELKKGFIQNLTSTINRTAPTAVALMVMSAVLYLYNPSVKENGGTLISLGNLMAFLSLFYALTTTVLNLWELLINTLYVVPIWESNRPILDEVPEAISEERQDIQLKGKIELSHIYFRYSIDTPYIHKDINIYAEPGELIAIVGNAGCGKSTIIKLLLGFEKPESGAIFFDGINFNSLDLQQIRGQIGVITQNSKVMDGSILENITGGSVCTLDQVMRAADLACFTDVLNQLPMGLHTTISHGCDTLSGGQLQRLFIARALVNSPKILFLDEATNALDNVTQSRVTRNIEYLNVTRIVIAHRLSTIRRADRIYVLDAGSVIECGNYDELIDLDGHFAKLVKLQSLI